MAGTAVEVYWGRNARFKPEDRLCGAGPIVGRRRRDLELDVSAVALDDTVKQIQFHLLAPWRRRDVTAVATPTQQRCIGQITSLRLWESHGRKITVKSPRRSIVLPILHSKSLFLFASFRYKAANLCCETNTTTFSASKCHQKWKFLLNDRIWTESQAEESLALNAILAEPS